MYAIEFSLNYQLSNYKNLIVEKWKHFHNILHTVSVYFEHV